MFKDLHFVWLGITAALIIIGVLAVRRYKPSVEQLLNIVCACCVISEVVKIFCTLVPELRHNEYGVYIKESDLPFHLCSMQIFLSFITRFTSNKKVRDFCLTFMVPTCILGGIAAILIPTISCSFANPRTYQYFLYHISIVWFGIAVLMKKEVRMDLAALGKVLMGMFIAMMLAIYINGFTQKTNFLYVAAPPMDGLPILNMDNGWFVYFLSYVGVVILVLLIFFTPFWIYYGIKRKRK